MASSSSSLPKRGWTYEVFLSFRGEDTRNSFVDHLYTALIQKGIHPFKDDQMLRGGKSISSELLRAIEESKFAVVVFSENYANSSWCLQELTKIMECHYGMGQKVLPVFYHVDPSDVRKQKGNFSIPFQEHENRFDGEKNELNKWREALTTTAKLSGYHISPVSGGESASINKIVQAVLHDTQACRRENNLVGMESHIHKLNSLLCLETTNEVRFIGIHGMGGVGKTTIARSLFKRILYRFEGSSFVKDIKGKRDVCALQRKILKDTLALNHDMHIEDPEDGADMLQDRLCNKKVLLVLDDLDHFKQLEFLAATHEWFGPGSRIIITTRDERLLSHANAKYKPSLLTDDEALELFSKHAFLQNGPPKGYEELSNHAMHYTGHLPLAVKVLGSFFRGRQAYVWGSALDKLAKTPNNEIFKTLKLSFDGLEESEKKLFLDIACFYKGIEVKYLTRLLRSFGFYPKIGISSLIEKSLITVSQGMMCMHELLQEMGLQIVYQSGEDSRLWRFDVIQDFIKKGKNLEGVESLVPPRKKRKQMGDKEYDENGGFEGSFISCEPIVVPRYWNNHSVSSLPLEDISKLVGLEIKFGKIKCLWKGQQMMQHLKFVHLYKMDFLTRFPDVSGAPNVESVIISDCTELVEVDESLGLLKRLVHLDLSGCINLKCLPSQIELESLETMIPSYCRSLQQFQEYSENIVKLLDIDLSSCEGIQLLPYIIYASNLAYLKLTQLRRLEKFPKSIQELTRHTILCLHDCWKLKTWPDHISSMKNLRELSMRYPLPINIRYIINFSHLRVLSLSGLQIKDQDFPKNFHGLFSLKILSLSGNSALDRLPSSISHLCCLAYLDLSYCRRLKTLQGLPSEIRAVDAFNCISLETIEERVFMWVNPSDSNLTQCLVGITHLPRLECLDLSFCWLLNLQVLPSEIHETLSLELIEDGAVIPPSSRIDNLSFYRVKRA